LPSEHNGLLARNGVVRTLNILFVVKSIMRPSLHLDHRLNKSLELVPTTRL
jgi:hypothetical protein